METRQPSDELVKFLSTVGGIFINMAEFTLDLIFENEVDRDRAFEFIDRHHVKKGHRTDVRYHKGTRYTIADGQLRTSSPIGLRSQN